MERHEFEKWAADQDLTYSERDQLLEEISEEHGGLDGVESVEEVEDVARSLGLIVGLVSRLWRTITGWF